ncbi:MAG: hypothetical protein ACQ9CV_01450 [Nitrosopumilus sp.]|jgi:hypothetical protein
MTYNNARNIAIFSIVALFTASSFGISNVYAEESEREYKMVGDVQPVLTFEFRDGTETYEFPVFEMGENFAENSGVSFSVEGTVTNSPLLHAAMDEAYKYRFSNDAFDYQLKYFDVNASFLKKGESIISLDYSNCRIENYQVETVDSNDYESYFKEVGFAIVDKIDFVCSGLNSNYSDANLINDYSTMNEFAESGFKFANDMHTAVTFNFDNGAEKIYFPVFNLVSGYEDSAENVVAEFEVEGVLDYYPLLYNAIDKSRQLSGLSTGSNVDFDALVEFTNTESTLRGFDFSDCRISDARIITQTDKEEGFTGKSGFVLVLQSTFTCSGLQGVNMYYDTLRGDAPVWKTTHLTNDYVESIQNTDGGLDAIATFTFADGTETIEFSMFKQSEVLSATEDTGSDTITNKATYPTLELRGIVGDYPMVYDHVDDTIKVQGLAGTSIAELIDIDVDLVLDGTVIRGFNYNNCRAIDYTVETETNKEESYVKDKFALENIFLFECQGYHPNNPVYDAMFSIEKANTPNSSDLRNTDQWSQGFTVRE